MFSSHPKKNFCFQVTFILSSANALNLDQSKKLLLGKELIRNQAGFCVDDRASWDIVVKEENTGNQNFLLFPLFYPTLH